METFIHSSFKSKIKPPNMKIQNDESGNIAKGEVTDSFMNFFSTGELNLAQLLTHDGPLILFLKWCIVGTSSWGAATCWVFSAPSSSRGSEPALFTE